MTTVSLAPRGRDFVRGLIANTLATGEPAEFAANRWGVAHAERIAKAAVPAILGEPGGTPEAREFFAMAVQQSLLGRIPGLRRIGFNTPNLRQDSGATGYWVAEARPIPLSKAALERFTLAALKIATITVATKESLFSMGEVQEAALQRDLLRAIAGGIDLAFIDPDNAGVADTAPASITYGATQFPSAGEIVPDIRNLFDAYRGSMQSACIVMHPRTAVRMGTRASQLGKSELTVQGGILMGVPVVCTEAVPFDSNGGFVTILDASSIAYGARDFDMEMSDQTALQMSDSPTHGGTEYVSLWQTNSVAWKAEGTANWEVAGSNSVVTLTHVAYDLDN